MFQAQYLLQGTTVYSPWMPRKGNTILFTCDLVARHEGRLEVRIFHKKEEDDGNGIQVGGTISTTAIGQTVRQAVGLFDLVRYEFKSVSTAGSPDTLDRVLFRMLSPVWFDAVNAV